MSSSVASDLTGRVALVTGAGNGIGAACAAHLAAAGAQVAVADVDGAAAERAAAEIAAAGGAAWAVVVDVADAESVDRMVAGTVERCGRLDLAVNNAGIAGRRAPLAALTARDWRAVMAVNLDGVFHCLRAEIAAMRAGGHGGAVVNMASILGAVGTPGVAPYVAAKHGVVGLTKVAALEYAAHGIRVNAVGPGYIGTPLLETNLDDTGRAAIVAATPAGRLGTPAEVAALVGWLLGDQASFVTGAYYPVDGGYLAR